MAVEIRDNAARPGITNEVRAGSLMIQKGSIGQRRALACGNGWW
jgi:hypothetical protein